MRTLLPFCMLLCGLLVVPVRADIKVGVLARSGSTSCLKRWAPLGEYLEERIGEKVYILPLEFDVITQVLNEGSVDYLLANPFFYVMARKKFAVRPIATLVNRWRGRALSRFGGVFFTRVDSPVEVLEDLHGRNLMVVDYSSFGGCYIGRALLREKGLDHGEGAIRLLVGITHENVVMTVKNGLVVAGTVRTGVLERMATEGRINMEEFRILHLQHDEFPLVHSTGLYPEWPFAALAHVGIDQSDAVGRALIALPADNPLARRAGIMGWRSPSSYREVEELVGGLPPVTP